MNWLLWPAGAVLLAAICLIEWGRRLKARIGGSLDSAEALWPLAEDGGVETFRAAGIPELTEDHSNADEFGDTALARWLGKRD